MDKSSHTIAALNDGFRTKLKGGRLFITAGLVGRADLGQIIEKVRAFDKFNEENDPHGEHDFGAFEHEGKKLFWKMDYYDLDLRMGSSNPADPNVTTRVLTVMLASEY